MLARRWLASVAPYAIPSARFVSSKSKPQRQSAQAAAVAAKKFKSYAFYIDRNPVLLLPPGSQSERLEPA